MTPLERVVSNTEKYQPRNAVLWGVYLPGLSQALFYSEFKDDIENMARDRFPDRRTVIRPVVVKLFEEPQLCIVSEDS